MGISDPKNSGGPLAELHLGADFVATAAALGASVGDVRSAEDGAPFVITPEGYKVHNLESTLLGPVRKRGTTAFASVESFVRFIKDEGADLPAGEVKLYGVIDDTPRFTAVLNSHYKDGEVINPGWGDYRASYNCPLAKEWKIWKGKDGVKMSQADFAQFIEDNSPDCLAPDSATMIEISRTLEAKKGVSFASGVRLDNGQTEFTYEETIQGSAGKGKFAVPEVFEISIPVLTGMANYVVQARLRYRIGDGGKLTMWYDLVRPHKIIEHAVNDVWAAIQEGSGLEIYRVEEIPKACA